MEELQQTQDQIAKRVETALASQDIPHLYANGFLNALSNADITMVLERNNYPVAVLNMSYTTAKSLAHKLSQIIADFEKASNHTIMTSDVVNQTLFQKSKGQP